MISLLSKSDVSSEVEASLARRVFDFDNNDLGFSPALRLDLLGREYSGLTISDLRFHRLVYLSVLVY